MKRTQMTASQNRSGGSEPVPSTSGIGGSGSGGGVIQPKMTSNIRIGLFETVYLELDALLNKKFTKHIKVLVSTMYDYDSCKLLRLIEKLKKINKMSSTTTVKQEWKLRYKKLLLSINNINDADSHPIGLDLSIFLHSDSAQETLNVKQLNVQTLSNKEHRNRFQDFVESELNLEYTRIVPKIDTTLLYSNNINWIRVRIRRGSGGDDDEIEEMVRDIVQQAPDKLKLFAVFNYSPTILEFYFKDKNVVSCLEYFNDSTCVEEIIFYSNSKLMKQKCTDNILFLSNLVKFFYCYLNTSNDFSIGSMSDVLKLNYYYLLGNIFVYKDNMKTGHCEALTTPLNILTGSNPKDNVANKVKLMEPLEEYDRSLISNEQDLRSTAISERSLGQDMRHKVYELANDRDFRLLGRGSRLGGRNMHELVVTTTKTVDE